VGQAKPELQNYQESDKSAGSADENLGYSQYHLEIEIDQHNT
jgi:hypothetical protein